MVNIIFLNKIIEGHCELDVVIIIPVKISYNFNIGCQLRHKSHDDDFFLFISESIVKIHGKLPALCPD